MAKPLLVLADPDVAYLKPLEFKFLVELGDSINVCVITEKAYFDEYLMAPHDIAALLVDESWQAENLDNQNIESLFVLVEDHGRDRTSIMDAEYTFKYTSIDTIFNKVLSVCSQLRPKSAGAAECLVVLFFSPVGGSGCTTAALGTAAALQSAYKRVLFVDAEHIQSFKCYLSNGKAAPSSMVRDMVRLSGDSYENLRSYLENDGFDYLPPLRAALVSYGVEFDFFLRFIEAARGSGAYDYVIVDTDSVFDEDKTALVGMADKVVVTVNQDAPSLFKTMKLVDNLDISGGEKFKFICDKYREGSPNAFADSAGGATVELDGFVSYTDGMPGMTASQLGELSDFRSLARSLD